ncbi:MAG: hypothetical protein E7487_05390 [Ruminococcaceae bacterium]|nr:hypothetical protein [Oscillospiraceae bacterium]
MVDILLGGGLALLFGAGLSVGNYFLTKKLINRQKNTSPLAVISFLRQTFNIAYLVAIYFLSKVLPWPMEAMLIGAALGITIPSFLLSAKLSRSLASPPSKTTGSDEAEI